MLLKFILVLFVTNGVQPNEISLCEAPAVPNLSCLRIGNKLKPELYEVNKCDAMTAADRKGLFFCVGKAKLSSHGNVYRCINGEWTAMDQRDSGLPTCQVTCPELLYQTETMIVKDQYGDIVPNDERVVAGTILDISCRGDYVKPNIYDNETVECLNTGKWSTNVNDCIKSSSDGIILPLSYGGTKTSISQFPYHVGIYKFIVSKKKHSLVCGGSIVAEQVIVSAAHCFWNKTLRDIDDGSKYFIVAGKTHRGFVSNEESEQRKGVYKIYTHNTYKHSDTNYADDVAVVVVSTPFIFNDFVGKVVPTSGAQYWSGVIPKAGRVVGWGKTENGTVSDTLRFVDLDIVKCTPRKSGKFCAVGDNQSTCEGDSGGGFVVYNNNNPLLIGVVSTATSINNTGCTNEAATYNHFDTHGDLFLKASSFLKDFFPCPNHMIKCNTGCLPLSQVCDGTVDCSHSVDEYNCTIKSSYSMLSKGLEIIKYFEKCVTTFPNLIIPTSGIWLAAKWLSEVSSKPVSDQLKIDFGLITDPVIVSNIREASIIDAQLRSTIALGTNKWTDEFFTQQTIQRKVPADFFYRNATPVTILYDSDLVLNINGFTRDYNFRNGDGSVDKVSGICATNVKFFNTPNEKFFKIETKDNFNLYIVEAQGNIRATMANLRAHRLDKLNNKLGASTTVCFPKINLLTSADYSPILYKLGYDYAFSLDPMLLRQVADAPVRVQTLIRAFLRTEKTHVIPNDQQMRLVNNVDKPFFFILEETKSNSVIFVGRIIKAADTTRYANAYTHCKPFSI